MAITPENAADAIVTLLDIMPPAERRAAVKIAAERYGFTVTDDDGLREAAEALGIDYDSLSQPR